MNKSDSCTGALPDTLNINRNVTWQELEGAAIEEGVPTDTCPVVSTAPSKSADYCRLESDHRLNVMLCLQSGNTEGTLLIYSLDAAVGETPSQVEQTSTPRGGSSGNIYRIRVSGQEILQPVVHYCVKVAAAGFKVTYSGTYHLQVLQLYENFN